MRFIKINLNEKLNVAAVKLYHGICDIRVLDESWNVVETIKNEDLKPVV